MSTTTFRIGPDPSRRSPIKLWFTMVFHPDGRWVRVGKPHHTKSAAAGWVSFVKAAWHHQPVRVRSFTIRFDKRGNPTAATIAKADSVFNLDINKPDESK